MIDNGPTFDVEGLALAWARGYPWGRDDTAIIGVGAPVLGLHLTEDARSPGRGVLASLAARGTRTVDPEGLGDKARISFEFKAIGGEGGAKRQCERGARAFARALRLQQGDPTTVTSADGDVAKLGWVQDVNGPVWVGAPGGEATYRVDATMVWMRAT